MTFTRPQDKSRIPELFGAGLFVLYAVVLFANRQAPRMTDVANWAYQGALLARHLRRLPDAAHILKTYPVPNSAATLGIGLFASAVPWQVAVKLYLCLQMAITFAAIRSLAGMIGADGAVWWIVPQAAFLGVNWWYGFLNFDLGLAWVLLMASMLLRRAEAEQGRAWTLSAMLVLAFFTHMISFAFCALLLLLYARQTGRWRSLWQAVPASLLSAWYLIGRFVEAHNADGNAGMVATVRDYSAAFWAYKVNSYVKSFGFVNPSSLHGSAVLGLFGRVPFLLLLLVDLLLAVLLGQRVIVRAFKVLRGDAPERFLWIGMLLLLPGFLLAPGTALGVSDPGSRLLQTALVLAIVLVCREPDRLLRLSSVCGGVLSLAGLLLFARLQLDPVIPVASTGVPQAIVQFAHVPFDDQVYFYAALDRGDYGQPVFPTGIFLNRPLR